MFHIFERFAADDSLEKIYDSLARMNASSHTDKEFWRKEAILKVINNEKYLGNVVLCKTQFKKRVQIKNYGLNIKMSQWVAIITKELFELVEMEKRCGCRSHER